MKRKSEYCKIYILTVIILFFLFLAACGTLLFGQKIMVDPFPSIGALHVQPGVQPVSGFSSTGLNYLQEEIARKNLLEKLQQKGYNISEGVKSEASLTLGLLYTSDGKGGGSITCVIVIEQDGSIIFHQWDSTGNFIRLNDSWIRTSVNSVVRKLPYNTASVSGNSKDTTSFVLPLKDQISSKFVITNNSYSYDYNMDKALFDELGGGYRIADWADVKDYSSNIEEICDALGIKSGDSMFITAGGSHFYAKDRHYFIIRHDHSVPSSFLDHDDIDNNYISLGSWKGKRRLLCIKE